MTVLRTLLYALTALLLALTLSAESGHAQRVPDGERRAQLEQQIRQRMARVLKERLELTDEQLERVGAVNRKYEERRRLLVEQERDIRIAMRQEVLRTDQPDQERIARLINQSIQVQRQRLQVIEDEQKDLAEFMSPVQRAKYLAVQEQVHRAIEEMRRPGAGRQPAVRRPQ